jgi:hypothetical protein
MWFQGYYEDSELILIKNLVHSQEHWLTFGIPATWDVETGELQFRASLGKSLARSYLKNNWVIMYKFCVCFVKNS